MRPAPIDEGRADWRRDKALRLVHVLRSHGATSRSVRELPAEGWALVADLAGVPAPSPIVADLVADLLTARPDVVTPPCVADNERTRP